MKRAGVPGAGTLSFGVLLVSQLAATTGFMFVIPFLPLYVQRLGVEDAGHAAAWAGLLNTATAVTMALAGSMMLGLMGLVTSPWQLLLLRLLQGSLTGR